MNDTHDRLPWKLFLIWYSFFPFFPLFFVLVCCLDVTQCSRLWKLLVKCPRYHLSCQLTLRSCCAIHLRGLWQPNIYLCIHQPWSLCLAVDERVHCAVAFRYNWQKAKWLFADCKKLEWEFAISKSLVQYIICLPKWQVKGLITCRIHFLMGSSTVHNSKCKRNKRSLIHQIRNQVDFYQYLWSGIKRTTLWARPCSKSTPRQW